MTDNFDNEEDKDDFTEAEVAPTEEPKTSSGMSGNLAEAWRTKPMFKFMVLVVAVFAIGAAAANLFGGESKTSDVARLARPPSMKEAPGGNLSPFMKQQTELANQERSQQAIATGGSALPTPVGQAPDGFGSNDRSLAALRAETEALKKQVALQQAQQQQQQQQAQRQAQQQTQQFDGTLAQAMQHQMQQLLESWTPQGIKNVTVTSREEARAQEKAESILASTASKKGATRKLIVSAGTVSYAQLLTEANSDVPGPIMVQIVSGPLAGARAIGAFQVSNGYEKYLVLKFSLADKAGKDYRIDAIALDPDTTLGGMATEVDERYFTRVILPAAAGFLQGLGQSMGQGNSTITTNGSVSITTLAGNGFKEGMYNGLGQAAQTAGQFFQQQANLTKPLVRVAAGTPMGIFFVAPVYEPTNEGITQDASIGAPTNYGYSNNVGNAMTGYGVQEGSMPYPARVNPAYGYVRNPSTTVAPYGNAVSPYSQGYGQ